MELESLFGLPAHPLVVHAVVVLLPLAAAGLVITALIPRSRRAYAPLVLAIAVVALVSVSVAEGSGEELEDRVDETEAVEEHTERGETVLPWAIAVAVVAAAVVAAGPVHRRYPDLSPKTVTAALVVAAVISSTGAVWTVTEVGHSGAKASWEDVQSDGDGDDD
jgi:hypothetical protein